jgi:hypothetical protein
MITQVATEGESARGEEEEEEVEIYSFSMMIL